MKSILSVLLIIMASASFASDLPTCDIEGRLAGVTIAQKRKALTREVVLEGLVKYLQEEKATPEAIAHYTEFVGHIYDTESAEDLPPRLADSKYWGICFEKHKAEMPEDHK